LWFFRRLADLAVIDEVGSEVRCLIEQMLEIREGFLGVALCKVETYQEQCLLFVLGTRQLLLRLFVPE
jgi:hypothetical protein